MGAQPEVFDPVLVELAVGRVAPEVFEQDLETALTYQRATGKPLGEVLISMGIMTEAQILAVLAAQRSVEPWDLKSNPPTTEAIAILPM